VLFVEDSVDDVELLVQTLRHGGFDVDWARVNDAAGFKARIGEGAWDIILCAFSMASFDPHQALQLLREAARDIPLVVVSGSIPESTAVDLMKAGVRDYLLKANLRRLVPVITRELRDAMARRESREAHRVMRRSEEFFRTVVEHASDLIAVTDLNGMILHIAPSVEHVIGRNAEELIGSSFLDLLVDEDRPRSEEKLRALGARPGVRLVSEVGFRHVNGTVRILECAARSFRTPAGEHAIAINARDVTDRLEQERTLRESGARLALLNAVAHAAHFGASADAIVNSTLEQLAAAFPGMHALYSRVDENGFLVSHQGNGAAAGVDVEGRSLDLSTVPALAAVLQKGEVFAAADRMTDTRLPAMTAESAGANVGALAIAPLADAGRLKGALSLLCPVRHVWTEHELTTLSEAAVYLSLALNEEAAQRDRRHAESALQQSEDQLRQAQKMEAIGLLAGGIAHDFNNLLTAILGYGEIVAEEIGDHPAARDVEQILDAGRRAATLTRQLLAFSRQQRLAPVILCPNDVVSEMAQLLGRLLGHDIELRLDMEEDTGNIKVDRGQLEQVLMNLAVNARDAMPDGGRLTIKTRSVVLDSAAAAPASVAPGPHVLLEVSDSGTGMDAATMSHIFEPFFTTKEKGHGTGLGLATVYGIVTQSGGGVEVESSPGVGATFRLYFPETDEIVTPVEPRAANDNPLLVLIVEPDESVRTEARKVLTRAGHTLLEATSLDRAVALADRNAVDVLLVGGSAEPLTAVLSDALRQRSPSLRVAVLPPVPFNARTLIDRIEGGPSGG
jgi:PAS domain S-box-containing protein